MPYLTLLILSSPLTLKSYLYKMLLLLLLFEGEEGQDLRYVYPVSFPLFGMLQNPS